MQRGQLREADVVVIGAGPTGLMLATELRLRGVTTIVVEKLQARSEFGKALNIQPRTAEILDLRGLLADAREKAEGAIPGSHYTVAYLPYGPLDTRYPYQMVLPQAELEEILERRFLDLGGDLRRGWNLTDIRQDEDSVTVSGPETLTARYAVACDGGRSSVRKTLGLAFPGTEATEYFTMADIRLGPRGKELPRLTEQQREQRSMRRLRRTEPGGSTANLIPYREAGMFRILYNDQRTTRDDVTREQLVDALHRFYGDDYELQDILYAGRFGDASRQVENYRTGRVFLAGDAAHIHLPAGGQGLNLGVQDAFNLGWKLAAVIAGSMPETLLDTYHAERHPVGARVLENTRGQNALRISDPDHQALGNVLAWLLQIPEANRAMAAMVSGIDIDYGGQGPIGTRLRDFKAGSTWASTAFHTGHGVLLACHEKHLTEARPWSSRVAGLLVDDLPAPGYEAVLVRPDGYICATVPGEDLSTSLLTWFGTPD
ncbi:FAD-dependent monooxygenase [Amycolatopsis mediterranei]|uniref:FAD-dependent monooxygenase n=1 Tax=Amycolatopsis mediterranei TaxID=33910 RepID=UPI00343FF46F